MSIAAIAALLRAEVAAPLGGSHRCGRVIGRDGTSHSPIRRDEENRAAPLTILASNALASACRCVCRVKSSSHLDAVATIVPLRFAAQIRAAKARGGPVGRRNLFPIPLDRHDRDWVHMEQAQAGDATDIASASLGATDAMSATPRLSP